MSDHLRKRSMLVDLKQAAQIKGSQTSPLDEKLEYANPPSKFHLKSLLCASHFFLPHILTRSTSKRYLCTMFQK